MLIDVMQEKLMNKRYIKTAGNLVWKPVTVTQPPLHIQVELTTYCNLNCKPCARAQYLNGAPPTHLTPGAFVRIVESIRPTNITLSGVGEPLMSPHLVELIRIAKTFGVSINTTTNGTLLTPERSVELVKSGLDLLKVSVDAATPETYRSMRGANTFWHVLDGIRMLNDLKKQLHSATPAIRFNYVVSQHNYQEMAETVKLAEKLGVPAIYFQPLDLFGLEDRRTDLVGDLTIGVLTYEIRRALRASQHTQVQTNLQDFLRRMPDYWRKYQLQPQQQAQQEMQGLSYKRLFSTCLLPWFSAYITVNGDMRPCCTCLQTDTSMGNVLDMSVDAVWNGERYQQLRQLFRDGKRPFPVCETCVPKTLTTLLRYATLLPGFIRMPKS